jgi:dipeptide/tripeptide permease
LIWIAALVIALIAAAEGNSRYRWWSRYLAASLLFAPFYWPDIPGWNDSCWPWLIVLFAFRLVGVLEAVQYQTRDLVLWSKTTGGVFLISFGLCILIWKNRGFTNRDIGLNLLHYGRVWTGCMWALLTGFLLSQDGLRNRREDWVSFFVGMPCWIRAVVSVLYLSNRQMDWHSWDIGMTLFEAAMLAGWTCAITFRSSLPETAPNRVTAPE